MFDFHEDFMQTKINELTEKVKSSSQSQELADLRVEIADYILVTEDVDNVKELGILYDEVCKRINENYNGVVEYRKPSEFGMSIPQIRKQKCVAIPLSKQEIFIEYIKNSLISYFVIIWSFICPFVANLDKRVALCFILIGVAQIIAEMVTVTLLIKPTLKHKYFKHMEVLPNIEFYNEDVIQVNYNKVTDIGERNLTQLSVLLDILEIFGQTETILYRECMKTRKDIMKIRGLTDHSATLIGKIDYLRNEYFFGEGGSYYEKTH